MSNYIDDYQPTAGDIDPLAHAAAVEFPFEQVFADLDGEEVAPDYSPALSRGIRAILAWLVETRLDGAGALEHLGKRTLALAWAIDPNLLEGAPSIAKLGRRLIASTGFQRLTLLSSKHFNAANRQQAQASAPKMTGKESLSRTDSMAVASPSDPLARENEKSMPHAPSTPIPHE